jgi:hypothetical protein
MDLLVSDASNGQATLSINARYSKWWRDDSDNRYISTEYTYAADFITRVIQAIGNRLNKQPTSVKESLPMRGNPTVRMQRGIGQ